MPQTFLVVSKSVTNQMNQALNFISHIIYYEKLEVIKMSDNYLRWSEVSYAGERKPPIDPVTSLAGSWPLFYIKRDKDGDFLDPNGGKMRLPITHPSLIDFFGKK